jgi:hypothetical protein
MFTYGQNDLRLSDFHSQGLDASGGDFFSLTASEPVEVQRTGRTYSAAEQRKIFSEAATAFYITLTMAQFCHIWVCKTRTSSLFKHGFGNKLTFYGVRHKSAGFLGCAALRPDLSFGSTMRVPNGIFDARSLAMCSFGSLLGNLQPNEFACTIST